MSLSPAFSPRDPGELEFLRSVNPKTGFSLFWIDIVRPLLEHCGARQPLEIGAWDGEHTSLLLEYAEVLKGIHRLARISEPQIKAAKLVAFFHFCVMDSVRFHFCPPFTDKEISEWCADYSRRLWKQAAHQFRHEDHVRKLRAQVKELGEFVVEPSWKQFIYLERFPYFRKVD